MKQIFKSGFLLLVLKEPDKFASSPGYKELEGYVMGGLACAVTEVAGAGAALDADGAGRGALTIEAGGAAWAVGAIAAHVAWAVVW